MFKTIFIIILLISKLAFAGVAEDISNLKPGEWYEIPNTHLSDIAYDWSPNPVPGSNQGFPGIMGGYSGGAFDTNGNRLLIWGGGHSAYGGNEIYAFDFDDLKWHRLTDPTSYDIIMEWYNSGGASSSETGLFSDGKPITRHTYDMIIYRKDINAFCYIGTRDYFQPGGGGYDNVFGCFNFNTSQWKFNFSRPPIVTRKSVMVDSSNDHIWTYEPENIRTLFEYDPSLDKWIQRSVKIYHNYTLADSVIDPIRKKLVVIGPGYYMVFDISEEAIQNDPNNYAPLVYDYREDRSFPGNVGPDPIPNGDTALLDAKYITLSYDSVEGQIIGWLGGNSVYALDLDNHILTKHTSNTVGPAFQTRNDGTYGRWRYVPSENVFVVVTSVNKNVFVYRPPLRSNASLAVEDNGPKYPDEPIITFNAYYKDTSTIQHIAEATCVIEFEGFSDQMNESDKYLYSRSFIDSGVYNYIVTCSKANYDTLSITKDAIIKSFPINDGIIRVGPTRVLTTVREAAAIVKDNDIVEIDAYLYPGDVATWYANNITIRGVKEVGGVGTRPHLKADGKNAGRMGIWVIKGNNYVVENIEFSGAWVTDGNGAGIRLLGDGLTVRYSYFHDNQNGIMTSKVGGGTVLVEYSEFNHNWREGYNNHNLYISRNDKFIFQYNYVHHAVGGHNIKSRAHENYILYNRIMDGADGSSSRAIDISEGGLTYIIGNVIQKGPNAQNREFIGYGLEIYEARPVMEVYISGNTFVNDHSVGRFFRVGDTTTIAKITNNLLVGPGTVLQGPGELTNNIQTDDPGFIDRDNFDYRLLSSSIAIDGGVDPGSAYEYDLTPKFHYVHPAGKEARNIIGNIDVGAYEYLSEGNVLLPPVNLYIKEN
ncbi:hypothetical protein LCGC14_1130510 [marine sediment metagenome]|uniref:Right handed beta helix domain-containing protein n=1 Tax=marine sediment metagenome TaxID=412755 RepID=A0A0F9MP06_9ZZZZ